MAKQLQLRRGTTAQHTVFTGAVGEVTIDTDKDALVMHDGVQAGGFPAARESVVTAHTGNTSNPHNVTKTQVGLGNVDNTSDVNKPISTATQTALNLKANLASPTFTGTPEAPTASVGTNSTQVATTAFVNAEISNGSNLVTSQTGAIGYGTGAGGTVTQLTSKYTAVTLNKPCGRIIMNNASLAAGATALFQVNNNLVVTTDNISVIAINNANYEVTLGWNTNAAFTIRVKNITAGALSESLNIQFLVCKGAVV